MTNDFYVKLFSFISILQETDHVNFAEVSEGVDWSGVLDLTADDVPGPPLEVATPTLKHQ